MSESKTNPRHYVTENGTELIDITETLNFNRGNVVKYVVRAGTKPGETVLDDLLKAQWYLTREIGRLRRQTGEE